MSVLEFKDVIPNLSQTERLQAMEWLWASLRREEGAIASPDWHGDVLASRKARMNSGEAQFLTLAQLKERLRR